MLKLSIYHVSLKNEQFKVLAICSLRTPTHSYYCLLAQQ